MKHATYHLFASCPRYLLALVVFGGTVAFGLFKLHATLQAYLPG